MKKLFLALSFLLLCSCAVQPEKAMEKTSIQFGEKLHDYSLTNPKWLDEINQRIEENTNLLDSNETGSWYEAETVHPEYLDEMEKAFKDICTEDCFEQLKKHLLYNRFHETEETVEFVELQEYENSYNSVIKVISPHYTLRFDLTFLKSESKPLVAGFKITILDFNNPE